MSLLKEIPISTLEIYKQGERYTIWLNSITGNILRLSNVNIINDFDKFNSLDIDCKTNTGKAIIPNEFDNNEELNDLRDFLILLNQQIINELYDEKELNFDSINEIVELLKEKHNNE